MSRYEEVDDVALLAARPANGRFNGKASEMSFGSARATPGDAYAVKCQLQLAGGG